MRHYKGHVVVKGVQVRKKKEEEEEEPENPSLIVQNTEKTNSLTLRYNSGSVRASIDPINKLITQHR